jgi:hypothetical protein
MGSIAGGVAGIFRLFHPSDRTTACNKNEE